MISIRVLGPGCTNWERVELNAIKAVEQLGGEQPELEVKIKKVNNPEIYMEYELLATPGLMINEQLIPGDGASSVSRYRWAGDLRRSLSL